MLKINADDWQKQADMKTLEEWIYPIIQRDKAPSYYNIMGLKLFMTCKTEGLKLLYAQKIVDYVNSLENEQFSLEYVEYENPKIGNGKFFSAVCNEMRPTCENDILK